MINHKRYDVHKNTYIYTKSICGRKESLKWDDDIINYDILKYEMLVSNIILARISQPSTKLVIRNKHKRIIKRSQSINQMTEFSTPKVEKIKRSSTFTSTAKGNKKI